MKRKLLSLLLACLFVKGVHSQCAITPGPSDDCASWGDTVDSFTLNGVAATGNAGCSSNGYASFNTPVWSLAAGCTYTFSAVLGGGFEDEGFAIWIDLNNNGQFAPSEMVYTSTTWAPYQTGSFTIPGNATLGTNVAMRLRCGFEWIFTGSEACASSPISGWIWGETEDHKINITGLTASSNPVALCTSGATSATLTANGTGSYTWNPGAVTSQSFVVSPTTSTNYTLTGSNAGCATSSAIVTVLVNTAVPVLTVTSSSSSVCTGGSATLTASGAITYTWTGNVMNASTSYTPSTTTTYTVSGRNGCGTSTTVATLSVVPLPVTAISNTNSVCAGANVTLTAGGATTYTWLPGPSSQTIFVISPVSNTTYTVTGRTGACSNTAVVSVNTQAAPSVSIVPSTTVICDGDMATLSAAGALNYTWSPGNLTGPSISVTPTLSTLYTLTGANAANCLNAKTQILVVNPKPVLNIAASNSLVCPNGLSTLAVSGASTYSWYNNSASNTISVHPASTTVYSVTGTSSLNCSNTIAVTVGVFDPTLSVSGTTAVCKGTNVSLSASGMDIYLWNNGSGFSSISVTPTITTTYTVESSSTSGAVTCSVTGMVTVTVNPNPTITAVSNPTAICKSESAVLNAGGATSYTWSPVTLNTSASLTVTPAADQTYTLTGENENGCKGSTTVFVRVAACVGIATNPADNIHMVVYPNPNNGHFTISSDQAISLQVINELGQLVKTIALTSDNKAVEVSDLSGGIYFITGKNENGSVKQKIVITK